MSRGGGAEMSRGSGSNGRVGGWHSFGNSRNASSGTNASGFTPFGASRAESSSTNVTRLGFRSDRFSTNMLGSSRLSPLSSFSSGGSRFGNAGFGGFDFGNSGFGRSGFSNSFLGSDLLLIPNLLFGGLLRVGPAIFGGPGILGVNALAFAASSIVSGLISNGTGQGGFAGGNAGIVPGGFGWGLGFDAAPVGPGCGAGASFQGPGWAWSGSCGPYPAYPLGWSGGGSFGGGRNGYNAAGDAGGNSNFN
jgi:hypothetical protein